MKMTKQKEKRKKRMKKVISLLLSVAMVLSLTAVEVMADDVETVTDDTETVADDLKVMTVDTETAEKKENAVTLDLSQGSIVISATGYSQNGGDETAFTGNYIIEQTNPTYINKTISVTSGSHKITMSGAVDIDVHNVSDACAFSITSGASVELVLAGPVTLKSGSGKAGLSVPAGVAVTISATKRSGVLHAEGGSSGAGIGGASNTAVGSIMVLGGTVEAVGGSNAAGIGGRYTGTGEVIHISGGKVTAIGGSGAAGIGGSNGYDGTGKNGQIIIDGTATVVASASAGAGIGGGSGKNGTGEGGRIVLGGAANVTAVSGSGAGIGSGDSANLNVFLTGNGGEVLITDNATVQARSNTGAGIGGGEPYYSGSGSKYNSRSYGTGIDGKLTINGNADVTAISTGASGIGAGFYSSYPSGSYATGPNGVISISGNTVVNATGAVYGIGGYDTATNGALNIFGGKVTAMATDAEKSYACGIGRINRFTVSGGTVDASGYTGIYSATVNSGVVTAESLKAADGFGTLTSNGSRDGWVVSKPAQSSNNMCSGVLFSGSEGTVIGDYYELPADREIPDGATLTVNAEQELIVREGTTLYVNGELVVNGKLTIDGTLNTAESGEVVLNGETVISGTISGKLLPLAIQAADQTTEKTSFNVAELFTIPENAGAVSYKVEGKNGATGTLSGSVLTVQNSGVFEVTATTQATAYYQAASATALLTAKYGTQPHVHMLTEFAAVEPDCVNSGNIHYWACQNCGQCFEDAECTKVISYESTIRDATGHIFVNGACTVCGTEDPAYQTNAVIEAGSLTTYPGDTIKVPISVRNNPGISSIKLTVTYDPAVLGYKGCTFNEELTSIAGSQTVVNDTQSGKVVLSWVVANAAYTDAEGDIVVLDFEVKSVAENTSSPVSISYEPESTFDNNLVDKKFLIKNGTVQVNTIRPGDINGDGKVDVDDALLLLNYTCGLRTDEVVGNPDVNGDGAVNNKDVVILLRYIAEVEGITLH